MCLLSSLTPVFPTGVPFASLLLGVLYIPSRICVVERRLPQERVKICSRDPQKQTQVWLKIFKRCLFVSSSSSLAQALLERSSTQRKGLEECLHFCCDSFCSPHLLHLQDGICMHERKSICIEAGLIQEYLWSTILPFCYKGLSWCHSSLLTHTTPPQFLGFKWASSLALHIPLLIISVM